MPRQKGSGSSKTEEKTDTKRTTITLPTAQYRALKIYCVQHDAEMSAVVSEALKKLGIEG
jgi:hypothetical protein